MACKEQNCNNGDTDFTLSLFFSFYKIAQLLYFTSKLSQCITAFCRSTLIVSYAAFDTLATEMINPRYCVCLSVTGYPI